MYTSVSLFYLDAIQVDAIQEIAFTGAFTLNQVWEDKNPSHKIYFLSDRQSKLLIIIAKSSTF